MQIMDKKRLRPFSPLIGGLKRGSVKAFRDEKLSVPFITEGSRQTLRAPFRGIEAFHRSFSSDDSDSFLHSLHFALPSQGTRNGTKLFPFHSRWMKV